MKNQKSTIKISELPSRAEKISTEDLTNVFGGCRKNESLCAKATDCCSNYCQQVILILVCR
jgi:hypothetical protein